MMFTPPERRALFQWLGDAMRLPRREHSWFLEAAVSSGYSNELANENIHLQSDFLQLGNALKMVRGELPILAIGCADITALPITM
jgi:hypothetical protein